METLKPDGLPTAAYGRGWLLVSEVIHLALLKVVVVSNQGTKATHLGHVWAICLE